MVAATSESVVIVIIPSISHQDEVVLALEKDCMAHNIRPLDCLCHDHSLYIILPCLPAMAPLGR